MAGWRKQGADEVFTPDEVTARLAEELPKWYFEDGWIRRKFKTSGWKSTLMVVNTVGHLAEAAWHHPGSPRARRLSAKKWAENNTVTFK